MTVYRITGEAAYEPERTENLINADKFATRDKYAAFLDGNNGYSTIEGNGTGSILVVKDSYANSFIPYLTANSPRSAWWISATSSMALILRLKKEGATMRYSCCIIPDLYSRHKPDLYYPAHHPAVISCARPRIFAESGAFFLFP